VTHDDKRLTAATLPPAADLGVRHAIAEPAAAPAPLATETVLLFPGQGAYDDAALRAARPALAGVREIFERIDAVAAGIQPDAARVTQTVLDSTPPPLEELLQEAPDLLQLTIYGLSVAVHRALETAGMRPGALVGHSLGEIAALVCGGAFSLEQGAELVCHRNGVLRAAVAQPGAMVALGCSAERARAMLELIGLGDVVVAADNSPKQSVVSGRRESLATVAAVARAIGVSFVEVQSPHAFHSPMLAPLVDQLAANVRHVRPAELHTPVYSPIASRWYQPGDDLPGLLASHLTRPVWFRDSVQQLHASGGRVFVECGARGALASLVRQGLPEATTLTCLDGKNATRFPVQQLGSLHELGQVPSALDDRLASVMLPGVEPAEASGFWALCSRQVLEDVSRRFAAYQERFRPLPAAPQQRPAPAPAPQPVPQAGAGSRQELFRELAAFYATALEYPEEVFTEHVELEADLGVDSVKQTELIAQVVDRYGLPERPADFRLGDYPTLGRVADFVWSNAGRAAARPETPRGDDAGAPQPSVAPPPERDAGGRQELFRELAALYATALEYPEEVFTEHVELEADLGVDSVKQTELIAQVVDRYGLPERPADFRLGDYPTLGRVADFVWSTRTRTELAA
jgi:acyl transferase domain-containing protein